MSVLKSSEKNTCEYIGMHVFVNIKTCMCDTVVELCAKVTSVMSDSLQPLGL